MHQTESPRAAALPSEGGWLNVKRAMGISAPIACSSSGWSTFCTPEGACVVGLDSPKAGV